MPDNKHSNLVAKMRKNKFIDYRLSIIETRDCCPTQGTMKG